MLMALSFEPGGDNMSSPEDWARSLGEEIRLKQSATREDAQAVAMHRDIIAEKMPLVWEEVLAAFQSHCIAYNEQLKPDRTLALHRTGSHSFMVRPDALPEIVVGQYDSNTKRILIKTTAGSEWFLP
jgi:hypothetical protein